MSHGITASGAKRNQASRPQAQSLIAGEEGTKQQREGKRPGGPSAKRPVPVLCAAAVRLDDATQEPVVDVESLAVGEEHTSVPRAAAPHGAAEVGRVRCVELDGDFGAGYDFVAREGGSGSCEVARVVLLRRGVGRGRR